MFKGIGPIGLQGCDQSRDLIPWVRHGIESKIKGKGLIRQHHDIRVTRAGITRCRGSDCVNSCRQFQQIISVPVSGGSIIPGAHLSSDKRL